MPTAIQIIVDSADDSFIYIFDNPMEEDREEERSANGENEIEEVKEFTIPFTISVVLYFESQLINYRNYQLAIYAADLSVPTIPPEHHLL